MHDPLVVAFEIRRPWPRRDSSTPRRGPRWKIGGAFWILAGRRYYFPSIITVWHREPRGHDSGEVCKHYIKIKDSATAKWEMKILHGWKWHVHHWRIQVGPLQALRRWALTHCAWCGDRSRKGDYVNYSHQWNASRGHWWQGEPNLYHSDCSSVHSAHRLCLCTDPLLSYDGYGQCALCGRFRSYGKVPDEADRLLAALPTGSRIPTDLRPQLDALWADRRKRREHAD